MHNVQDSPNILVPAESVSGDGAGPADRAWSSQTSLHGRMQKWHGRMLLCCSAFGGSKGYLEGYAGVKKGAGVVGEAPSYELALDSWKCYWNLT